MYLKHYNQRRIIKNIYLNNKIFFTKKPKLCKLIIQYILELIDYRQYSWYVLNKNNNIKLFLTKKIHTTFITFEGQGPYDS